MKKLINCNCSCLLGDDHGVQKTDGKILYCTMSGLTDCEGKPMPKNVFQTIIKKLNL